MQVNISATSLKDTKATMQEQLQRIIKEDAEHTEVASTSLKSLTTTLTKAEQDAKQKVIEAFPSPFKHIKDISVDKLQVEVLPTGFRFLDDNAFLKKGRPEIIIIGARPGHGKTALMMQIAGNVAQRENVQVFSLEMDERDIKARLLAPRISAPLSNILKGRVPQTKLHAADKFFETTKLQLCSDGITDIEHICQASFEASKQAKPELIVIDYLQICTGPFRPNKTEMIGVILEKIKELAVKVSCPIIIGSQVNTNCERRGKEQEFKQGVGDYRPMASELAESSKTVNTADVILLLSRHSMYTDTRRGEADIMIAKNRNGASGECVFDYSGELVSFYERRTEGL